MKKDIQTKSSGTPKAITAPKRYAFAIQPAQTQTETKTVRERARTKWVPFFAESGNVYINDLAVRKRRSSTHGAIIKSKHIFTVGEGFSYWIKGEQKEYDELDERQKMLLQANDSESLYDIFCKIALDWIYSGNLYCQGARVRDVIAFFHSDATTVRTSWDKDKFFITNYWRQIGNAARSPRAEYSPETIDAYKPGSKQKNFMLHLANYEPEFEYYGLPDHHGVLKWADIEYQIPTFNLNRIHNGFFPSVYMALFGQAPEGMTDKQFINTVVDKYTGEGNNSKIFAELLDDEKQKAHIHEFGGARDGEFKELDELAVQRIVSGHRWFTSLTGIVLAGKLGNVQQIRQEYEVAMNTIVRPEYQKPLLALMHKLLELRGETELKLDIVNSPPSSLNINPDGVLTIDEARAILGYPELENEAGKGLIKGKPIANGTNDGTGDNPGSGQ